MTEVWQMTRERFLGDAPVDEPTSDRQASLDQGHVMREVMESTLGWSRLGMRLCRAGGEHFIAPVPGLQGDVALVHRDPELGTFQVVGGYCGASLWVSPECRGQGLAAELVLARAERNEGRLEPGNYNKAGHASHVRAHRLAVLEALAQRMPVPQAVMDGYPDLMETVMT